MLSSRGRFRASVAFVAGLLLVQSSASAATLVYSNDVMGDIEPCGCRSNPLGGMVRKAELLAKLGDKSVLQLDAGDLLFSSDSYPSGLAKQAEIQAGYLLQAMDLLGHGAVVPGEKDFALGTGVLRKLISKSRTVFLAANIRSKSGKKLFLDSKIFTKDSPEGPVRIAVLGLVGKSISWPKDLRIDDPIQIARREVPKLRKKADIVILLTHEGLEADRLLASSVKGVDLIIGAHSQSFLQTPELLNGTRLYQSSFRNQYIGVLPLYPRTQGPFTGEGHRLIALDAGYDPAPGTPSKMVALVSKFKEAVAAANSQEDAKLTLLARKSEDAAAKYQTFPKCAECHLKQFDFWRKTPHGGALQPLVKKNQAMNKECLSCHSVGLGDPDGFQSVLDLAETHSPSKRLPLDELAPFLERLHTAKSLDEPVKLRRDDTQAVPLKDAIHRLGRVWAPVQCENCHQPGRDHPFSGKYDKKVAQTRCLSCHTAQQAPAWYTNGQPDHAKIEAKKAMITCPAGELGDES